MIAVIQRVKRASVSVENRVCGECKKGLMILLGVAKDDSEEDVDLLINKIVKLRIFSDEDGKMNLSLKDIDGEMLVVSNFTLLASYRKGNRPDYMNSKPPHEAEQLYENFINAAKNELRQVSSGEFGADMELTIINDGPVTIVMDSNVLKNPKKII